MLLFLEALFGLVSEPTGRQEPRRQTQNTEQKAAHPPRPAPVTAHRAAHHAAAEGTCRLLRTEGLPGQETASHLCFKNLFEEREREEKNSPLKGRKQVHPQSIYVENFLVWCGDSSAPSKRAWDDTLRPWSPSSSGRDKQPTNALLSCLESRLSCAMPEAQGRPSCRRGWAVCCPQARGWLSSGAEEAQAGAAGAGTGLRSQGHGAKPAPLFPTLGPGGSLHPGLLDYIFLTF